MPKRSSIALFIAATSALSIAASDDLSIKAAENDMGGLKHRQSESAKNNFGPNNGKGSLNTITTDKYGNKIG